MSTSYGITIIHFVLPHLVVIHDSVEGLDPHGVNVPIQHDPLGEVGRHVGQVTHDGGEKACTGGGERGGQEENSDQSGCSRPL